MSISTTDYRETYFLKPDLSPIIGKPTFESLYQSKVECLSESHNLKKVPASEVRLLCGTPKSLSAKICTDEVKDLPYKKVCRDIADYKEDVIKCDHATDSKVPRNICKQCLEEKKSKGSYLGV